MVPLAVRWFRLERDSHLGADVKWDDALNQVTFTDRNVTVGLTIDQHYAVVNGEQVTLDVPAVIKNDRTMAPLRFISESFGAQVDWLGGTQVGTSDIIFQKLKRVHGFGTAT